MINPQYFYDTLLNKGIDFYCGVPDSLLKDFCAYITDNVEEKKHFITANEGAAIGLASGYNIATGRYPLVYMQNSGIGNAVNPLLSLADQMVYSIPMVLLIGWRGEPGVKDEPQHIKQGAVTLDLLRVMGIEYVILSENQEEVAKQVDDCVKYISSQRAPFAFVVKKQTFDNYRLKSKVENSYAISREDAVRFVASKVEKDDLIIATTGMISRELYEYRERNGQGHQQDFLMVGSMGHASQIALGIALQKNDRRVFCFDGDGAILMHMGSLSTVGCYAPSNYIHIVFNNGAHDSVGGQPTVAFDIDLVKIAAACGYKNTYSISNHENLEKVFQTCLNEDGPIFIEIKVSKGARADLGRPKTSALENKKTFETNINSND